MKQNIENSDDKYDQEQKRQFLKQHVINEQRQQQKLGKDDYYYISKNSPCCKTIYKFTVCYLVALVIVALFLMFNNNYCLLDAPVHTLKIANHTGPITYNGLTTKQNNYSISTYKQNQFDYLSKFKFNPKQEYNSVYSLDETKKLRATNREGLKLKQFPIGIMINYTYVDGQSFNNTLKKLSFRPNDGSYVDDNGASIEIKITNKKRKQFRTNESWFNENYWEQYISDGSNLVDNQKILPLSGCQSRYFSQNDTFTLLDSSNPYNQIPLWLINIDTLTQPKVSWCADDYEITMYIHQYFCFSPLIIRQMNHQTIEFQDVQLHGQIIFDTQVIDDNQSELKFQIKNSTIDYLLLSNCKQIDEQCFINFDIVGSNVSLMIPNMFYQQNDGKPARKYFNVVGQQRESSDDVITFYKLQHAVLLTLQNKTIFKFENIKNFSQIEGDIPNSIKQINIISQDNKYSEIIFETQHTGDYVIPYLEIDVEQCEGYGTNVYDPNNEQF